MSTPPRFDGERPLFDLTGHPVDLDGKHYLESPSEPWLERRTEEA